MKNRNYLPEDWQDIFINRVRSVGVWCDVKESDHLRHVFVSRNPSARIAISLCSMIIAPLDRLHENQVKQKCLVCELYNSGKEDVKEQIINQEHSSIDDKPKPKITQQELL